MPKRSRVRRADFGRLRASRTKRLHGTYLWLEAAPLSAASAPKATCVVPKKVAARATERNAIKRRCREIVRVRLSAAPTAFALAFHAKPIARSATFEQLREDIAGLLARLS